jgi:hypothetical protein
MNQLKYDEFSRPVSVDFAPRGSVCEWCGQPAERQFTAIGGAYHNQSGVFCRLCGEQFLAVVINATRTVAMSQMCPKWDPLLH